MPPVIVTQPERLDEIVDVCTQTKAFAFDVETMGPDRGNPRKGWVTWLSIATHKHVWVIPMGHPNGEVLLTDPDLSATGLKRKANHLRRHGRGLLYEEYNPSSNFLKEPRVIFGPPPVQLRRGEVFPVLEPIFFDEDIEKIGHNVKFDLHAVGQHYGEIPAPPYYDTHVAAWLHDVTKRGKLGLADCIQRYLGWKMVKGVGEKIEKHAFSEVAKYSGLDASGTWDLRNHLEINVYGSDPVLARLRDLEMSVIEPVMEMESAGTRIDIDVLRGIGAALEQRIDAAEKVCIGMAGGRIDGKPFNLRSNRHKQIVLFDRRKLTPTVLTPKGKEKSNAGRELTSADYSVNADALNDVSHDPMVQQLQAHAMLTKLHGTYVIPYLGGEVRRTVAGKEKIEHVESRLENGRIHTQFVQTGAESGRFSCVAGDTRLITSRGEFTFEEYLPVEGDRVLTHEGRWRPVVRKIYKGMDFMYLVRSARGGKLTCTADHRVLTPTGWVRVVDLSIGDEVLHVSEQVVRERSGQRGGRADRLQGGRQANRQGSSTTAGDNRAQRAAHRAGAPVAGGVPGGEGTAVLTLEDGNQEPYAGQEWFPAPQLRGGDRGWPRLLDEEGERSVRTVAPDRDGGTAGVRSTSSSEDGGRPPHRREQEKQRSGQPGSRDQRGSQDFAQDDWVVEISPLGPMGVWDIEVEGDHSYTAHGFLNHNSRSPNLQNVPNRTPEGRQLRKIFIADPGHRLVVADYSQIEPRIIASMSGDRTMVDTYRSGGDVYQAVADRMSVSRQAGKTLVLAIAYGVGPSKIANDIGCSMTEAKGLMNYFASEFPAVQRHKAKVITKARREMQSTTVLGRVRRLPEIRSRDLATASKAERQAYNHRIQGSAADVMKLALVGIYDALPSDARMLMTVHDEVVVSAPEAHARLVGEIVKTQMEAVDLFHVPLVAEVGIGHTWSDGH